MRRMEVVETKQAEGGGGEGEGGNAQPANLLTAVVWVIITSA